MKTLLVAVDFSDASGQVMAAAREFAQAFGARLVLLHVVEPVTSFVPVGAAMDVLETAPPPVLRENLHAQETRLQSLATGIDHAETVAVVGLASDEIVTQAEDRGADLIVLGSHGHGALYHLFTGSVVTGVLKRAKIPVLVVPVGKRE